MSEKGFTLVEMALVVIIIGVLLGAVLKGTALIKSARAKRVVTDVTTLIDAQNSYYDRMKRYAGDSDNDGEINYTNLSSATLDGSASSSADADYAFNELKQTGLLGNVSNAVLAATQNGGYIYYAGYLSENADSAGNYPVYNMVVVHGVTCLSAFQLEQTLDNDSPDDTNSASLGRVRYISSGSLLESGAWTASNICASDGDAVTNVAVLFGTY